MKAGGDRVEELSKNLPTALLPQRPRFGFVAHEESAGNFVRLTEGAAGGSLPTRDIANDQAVRTEIHLQT